MKRAVVLFNLGGPDCPEAIEPFLFNLFNDPAVITLPALVRWPLARWIARRRAPIARDIYAKIGGRSPILTETTAQARALEAKLADTRVFVAMRCWKPFADEAAAAIAAWGADEIVLLPLYPQFSTTTTASSLKDWRRAARAANISARTRHVCCYPALPGLVDALAANARATFAKARPDVSYRWLLSAHGLPKRTIAGGDPYQRQVEQTAAALVERLGVTDAIVCYQSRVGPLEWIGPSTDAEIKRAGADGKGVVVVPLSFVSEHSETLVELDILYAELAQQSGVADYLRVPTAGVRPEFIAGLAALVLESRERERICPGGLTACGFAG